MGGRDAVRHRQQRLSLTQRQWSLLGHTLAGRQGPKAAQVCCQRPVFRRGLVLSHIHKKRQASAPN